MLHLLMQHEAIIKDTQQEVWEMWLLDVCFALIIIKMYNLYLKFDIIGKHNENILHLIHQIISFYSFASVNQGWITN